MKKKRSFATLLRSAPGGQRSSALRSRPQGVDRKGGDDGQGVILGASLIQRGEALGHRAWVDATMLEQVAAAVNAQGSSGIKARWTHPGQSSDGMGKALGRWKNASVDGDKVLADLHFAAAAHKAPDGDLADYLMTMIEGDDGDLFGISIAFESDPVAEEEFRKQYSKTIANGDEFGPETIDVFQSPDSDNTNSYGHVRLKELQAADSVDEPAANRDGAFSASSGRPEALATLEAFDSFLNVTLEESGLVESGTLAGALDYSVAENSNFPVHWQRAAGFIGRWFAQNGLSVHADKATDRPEIQPPANEIDKGALFMDERETAGENTGPSTRQKINDLEACMTHDQIGERAGVTAGTIGAIKSGEIANPSEPVAKAIRAIPSCEQQGNNDNEMSSLQDQVKQLSAQVESLKSAVTAEQPKENDNNDALSDSERSEFNRLKEAERKQLAAEADEKRREEMREEVKTQLAAANGKKPGAPAAGAGSTGSEGGTEGDDGDEPTALDTYKANFQAESGFDWDVVSQRFSERGQNRSQEEQLAVTRWVTAHGEPPADDSQA